MEYPRFSHTFNRYQRQHFVTYAQFRNELPNTFCALCLKVLCPEEVRFRPTPDDVTQLPIMQWHCTPTFDTTGDQVAVCALHAQNLRLQAPHYPGPSADDFLRALQFTYRERGALSPIKIMSQITRGFGRNRSYCVM